MVMLLDQAKSALRLPLDGALESTVVNLAFQKMARRYPVEQFPERFSEIREAYELLSNPVFEVRSLLFDTNPDLSSIFPRPACLNESPGSESEKKILQQLATILRYGTPLISRSLKDEMLGLMGDDRDDDMDMDGYSEDDFDFDSAFEAHLREMQEQLFGSKKPKKAKKARKK